MEFSGDAGWYTINVQYFDQANGVSRYRLWVGSQLIDEWAAGLQLPSNKLDSTTSTRRAIPGVALRPGDEIRVEGIPGGCEPAALDYLEILPAK
jgi:alpha-glucuronidase